MAVAKEENLVIISVKKVIVLNKKYQSIKVSINLSKRIAMIKDKITNIGLVKALAVKQGYKDRKRTRRKKIMIHMMSNKVDGVLIVESLFTKSRGCQKM